MSALAAFSMECGALVSGSDMKMSSSLKKLEKLGAGVYCGENPSYIDGADIVVYTSAVRGDNTELVRANELNKTVYERHEFLGMAAKKFKTVIAVGGTHGKTTVTAMIAHALKELGADFTAMIGGDAEGMGNYYASPPRLPKKADCCVLPYECAKADTYAAAVEDAVNMHALPSVSLCGLTAKCGESNEKKDAESDLFESANNKSVADIKADALECKTACGAKTAKNASKNGNRTNGEDNPASETENTSLPQDCISEKLGGDGEKLRSDGEKLGGDEERLDRILVAEACEYKQHLLSLFPDVGIITNIECDHPDCYGDLESIKKVFAQFAEQSGVCVLPLEEVKLSDGDKIIIDLKNGGNGEAEQHEADSRGNIIGDLGVAQAQGELLRISREDLPHYGTNNSFKVNFDGRLAAIAEIAQQGEFNKNNAMFAIAAVCALGYKPQEACDALSSFKGVKRRFERVGEYDGAQIIFDFAHHPTEIVCSLGIAKNMGRVLAVFQPHTYSRTAKYFDAFNDALNKADALIFMPTYAAREKPEDGADAYELYSAQKKLCGESKSVIYARGHEETVKAVKEAAINFNAVVFIGAGDIYDLKESFLSP